MKITQTDIVREALILLNEVGLDKLSTRMVAARLGVQQPAIYWHFKGKRELMDAMNAAIMRSSHPARLPDDGDDARSFLVKSHRSFRRALLTYRDGARVHAGSRSEASDNDAAERQLAFLVARGLNANLALRILITLSRFTVGFVMEEQSEAEYPPQLSPEASGTHPLLTAAFADYASLSQDQLFLDGLDAILDGFLAQHRNIGIGRASNATA